MATPQEKAPFGYDSSNCLKDLFLTWAFSLTKFYRASPPTFTNSIEIPERMDYENSFKRVKDAWKVERHQKSPNILNCLWKALKAEYLASLLPGMIGYHSIIFSTVVMIKIINYINNSDEPVSNIIGYIIAYIVLVYLNSFSINISMIRTFVFQSKIKAILARLIIHKSLKVHTSEISQGNQGGKLTSIISADLDFLDGVGIMIFFFSLPTFIICSAILLGIYLGPAGIIGLVVAVVHTPIIYYCGKLAGKYRFLTAAIGDERMKMITNLIEGIRIVKLYGWENPYLDSLFAKRMEEIKEFKKKSLVTCFNRTITYGSTGLVLLITFSIYVGLGNTIDPSTAFGSIALLIICANMISMIGGFGLTYGFLILVSMKRISSSLLAKETIKHQQVSELNDTDEHSIQLKSCNFIWNEKEPNKDIEEGELTEIRKEQDFSLKEITCNIKPGELVIVVGAVGAGKTTLFMGLLKEINLSQGEMTIKGDISFASEEPWIISGTIKENILMGLPYDADRYSRTISACCLLKDLDLFKEYRDQTMVGDRGITLSGGQKARVSLARAVYSNRSIILLDDPLSAVDPEVCMNLFKNCIKGMLSNTTVILATHQAHFVSQADKILVLDEGRQIFFGSYKQLISKGYESYLGKISQTKANKQKDGEEDEEEDEVKEIENIEAVVDKKSIEDEESAKGNVPFKQYWDFFMLGFNNGVFLILALLVQVVGQVSYLSVVYWIAYWSYGSDQTDKDYFIGMAVLVVILYLITLVRNVVWVYPLVDAAKSLHNLAVKGLTFTHSVYFDKNPTGRMLNRFSKDTAQTDEMLVTLLAETMSVLTLVFGNIIVVIIINPYILIGLALMLVYFYFLARFFTQTNKDLRRLELLTKSPILSILNSSIHGLSTIRCLNLQKKIKNEAKAAVDLNLETSVSFQLIFRAIEFYLELGPNLINVANIIILVCLKDQVQPGLAGMSIAMSITIMGFVGYFFRLLIETDNYMACPQRLFEYKNLEQEGEFSKSDSFKITEGKIEIKNLYMKYRENYDFALKNLNFTIKAGMKTGIIGRTGAGKSSIMQVLFRLTNPAKGTILIDGQDYLQAGLHDLRKQMSVIPQSATLFIASLKDNLDPFHEHSDEEIIKVMSKVRLKTLLDQLPDGLKTMVNSKALSLSAGQKQLVCLARAILRKNKIVMIDEATANVDSETDEFIQKQLIKRFRKSTLLVIAHRLRTIIDSDWIVVMDEGCNKEEGTPRELVEKSDSAFMKMIQSTGPEESQYLLSQLE